jgi:hypothetical protein
MRAVVLAVPLVLVLVVAGCAGSRAVEPSAQVRTVTGPASLVGSGAKTTGGTARFTLSVVGVVAGVNVRADENGAVSFSRRIAHIYKVLPGGSLPEELVIDGPFTYANGNVQAAMNDPTVKPWTKLDTRRLTAKQRGRQDELAHVRAPAYLVDGMAAAKRVGADAADRTTHFRGIVDPALLAKRLPAAQRAAIVAAVHNDFLSRPFTADFWVDAQGRVKRVHVAYRTSGGGHITVDAAYSDFGVHVDLTVPPARDVQNITPTR